jgi:hypothetical protein
MGKDKMEVSVGNELCKSVVQVCTPGRVGPVIKGPTHREERVKNNCTMGDGARTQFCGLQPADGM